jgi:preprotein translocase subunit SecD
VVITLRYTAYRPADVQVGKSILERRLATVGVRGASVDVDSSRHLFILHLPGLDPNAANEMRPIFNTAELRFRLILGALPYAGSNNSTCRDGALVTPQASDAASARVVLPDRPDANGNHRVCYALGPTLLNGQIVRSASAVMSGGQWSVEMSLKNTDFFTKVVHPNVGKNVAIVLDGVVQSAPMIQPGISKSIRQIQITGSFTENEAQQLALVLKYGALPLQFQFVSAVPA